MDFILNHNYEISNLVSLSGRYSNTGFQNALSDMVKKYKDFLVNGEEIIITTTKSLEVIQGEQIMDVEILLPIDGQISVENPYEFKKEIKITNALYTKIFNIVNLQENLNIVNQYILDNNLVAITSAYLIQTKHENKQYIEVYIGINPNIL